MCLYPKMIQNRKYTVNKKNKGIVPQIRDKRTAFVPVGCGKCMECRKQKARNWQVRLQEEIRENKNGKFVTLTFSNKGLEEISDVINFDKEGIEIENKIEGYEMDNEICRIAIRRYLERWRKKNKKSVRHWFTTEIGGERTERIHIHGLIFSNKIEDIVKQWKYGHVYIGDYVNESTINYIVKYLHKTDKKHPNYQPKIFTSSGIGRNYMNRTDKKRNEYKNDETKDNYKARNGQIIALPIYYRNKIYSDEERENLWIKMLDKNERYVNGVKIDVSEGMEKYYKVLTEAREKNKRLGYGDSSKDWDKINYENSLRRAGIKKE